MGHFLQRNLFITRLSTSSLRSALCAMRSSNSSRMTAVLGDDVVDRLQEVIVISPPSSGTS